MDLYTTLPWPTLCDEVMKLQITRPMLVRVAVGEATVWATAVEPELNR